jgi:hypothetical protein
MRGPLGYVAVFGSSLADSPLSVAGVNAPKQHATPKLTNVRKLCCKTTRRSN